MFGSVVLRRTLAIAAGAFLVIVPSAMGQQYVAGSDGSGDPFFPNAGNGGYDVSHYSLTLDYDQPTNFLSGTAVIEATATQNLRRFNLDLRDFYAISSLTVNGAPAQFARPGAQEVAISPATRLDQGTPFTVEVEYAGKPKPIKDPDKSIEGWIPTDDGAFVVNEPQGSPGWYPVNDSPRDKAIYDFAITVPAGREAVANGQLISQTTEDGKTTWRWAEDSPMAPYLATATNGEFLTESYSANGLFMYDAVDPNTRRLRTDQPNPALAFERLDPQPEIIAFFSGLYGPYPFTSGGGIIDWAPDVGYALEAQTRANYHRIPLGHGRARDRAPVVRQRRHARGVARHLAQRGLRHLLRVDLRRDARRPDRGGDVRRCLRDPGGRRGPLVPRACRLAPSEPAVPYAGL